ncbi:LOW QUALITY PROTEIN: hypothetical protein PHMEG_00040022 [Phytophthora megakarya]|uniref:HTH CENPB-type domain-containing protein n=1 Tax=Phytophthora megakarya TaxID=4795 RepID=A0A225UEH1_9STRA|nr:LOW QUALITY PROTEIN: hypothetical protein PHMEG_00040022 [Phytophthora megakarya]
MTQGLLAVWTKWEFKLITAPARNTISDILQHAAKIKNEVRCKLLKVTSAALESGLNAWVARVESKKVNINRIDLTEKAWQSRKRGGTAINLTLSIGWLTRFLNRHDMRFRIKKGGGLR